MITCAVVAEEICEVPSLLAHFDPAAKGDKPFATDVELDTGEIKYVKFHYVTEVAEAPANSDVVVICYVPLVPATFDYAVDGFVPDVIKRVINPKIVLAATRVELLGNEKMMDRAKEERVVPITVDESVEALGRTSEMKAIAELSASLKVNVRSFARLVATVGSGTDVPRPTVDTVRAQREMCVAAVARRPSTWTWNSNEQGVYYFNRQTGERQPDRPPDYDGEEPKLTEGELEIQHKRRMLMEESRLRDAQQRAIMDEEVDALQKHSARKEQLQKLQDVLIADIAALEGQKERMSTQVDELEQTMGALEEEKATLETKTDEMVPALAKVEAALEDELIVTTEQISELESKTSNLRGGDVDEKVAESSLRNKTLADRFKEVLEETLSTQQVVAKVSNDVNWLSRRKQENNKALESCEAKVAAVQRRIGEACLEVEALKAEHDEIAAETNRLRQMNRSLAADAGDKEREEHNLLTLIGELDGNIDAAKARIKDHVFSSQDHERLQLEAGYLMKRFAAEQTAVLQHLFEVDTLQKKLAHVNQERHFVVESLVEVILQQRLALERELPSLPSKEEQEEWRVKRDYLQQVLAEMRGRPSTHELAGAARQSAALLASLNADIAKAEKDCARVGEAHAWCTNSLQDLRDVSASDAARVGQLMDQSVAYIDNVSKRLGVSVASPMEDSLVQLAANAGSTQLAKSSSAHADPNAAFEDALVKLQNRTALKRFKDFDKNNEAKGQSPTGPERTQMKKYKAAKKEQTRVNHLARSIADRINRGLSDHTRVTVPTGYRH